MFDLARNDHHRRRELHILAGIVLESLFEAATLFDSGQLEQEIGVEEIAAEFAIGDRLEA